MRWCGRCRSPWQPELLIRAWAERVASELGVVAWIVDDTGMARDGKHSPWARRRKSSTLGKIGNCQIAVTLPLGFSLYLPE
jgi:SRSO17 transposase